MASDDVAEALAKLTAEIRSLREEIRVQHPEELLTVQQYAKVTKMTEKAVRAAIWRGTIKVERVGTRVRIRRPTSGPT